VTQRMEGESPQAYRARLVKLEKELKVLEERRRFRKIDFFKPYPKQQEFFDLGSVVDERMFRAGNQLGKSEAGAVEMAYHLTGEYPDDWLGKRFNKPVRAWACGVIGKFVRDVSQKKLFGQPGILSELGTGFVPKAAIIDCSTSRGVTDSYDTVQVRHKSGGISTLMFLSYDQGREKFQGDPVDVIWLDEEPSMEVYFECVARTIATKGIIYTTFTPMNGTTELFTYMTDPSAYKTRREVVMTMYDIGISQEEIERRLEKFPAYQRKSRLMGVPMAGEGAVFTTPEETIREPHLKYVPEQWFKLWAIDFGIAENHKFAAVLLAWDKDKDILHLLHSFKMANATPLQQCVQIKAIGALVPVAWPHDGGNREKGSGEEIQALYRKQGLRMCPEHATFETGGYSTEAGVMLMQEYMQTGRFKVDESLEEWFVEYRGYHRKDGLIVKQNDDLLSATRIGTMAKRMGKQVLLGGKAPHKNNDPDAGIARHAELSGSDLF
jgi:phage terminase large subunit-like protein